MKATQLTIASRPDEAIAVVEPDDSGAEDLVFIRLPDNSNFKALVKRWPKAARGSGMTHPACRGGW